MLKQRFVRAGFYKFSSTVSVFIISILTSVSINRLYDVNAYGLLVMVFSVTSISSWLASLGTKSSLNKMIPQIKRDQRSNDEWSYLMTAFILCGGGILLFFLIISVSNKFIAQYYGQQQLISLLRIGAFYLVGFVIVDFIFSLFQSFQNWKWEGILTILYPSIYLTLIFVFKFYFNASIEGVLYANIIAAALTSLVALYPLFKQTHLGAFRVWVKQGFPLKFGFFFTFGFPLLFTQLFYLTVVWSDKIILGHYSDPHHLSMYYISYTMIAGLISITKVIFAISMPYVAELDYKNKLQLRDQFHKIFKLNIFSSLIMALVSFLFMDQVVALLYGTTYAQVSLYFKLFLPMLIIKSFLQVPLIFLQNSFGAIGFINKTSAVYAFICVSLSMILIPPFGPIGAIVAVTVAGLAQLVIVLWKHEEIRHFIPTKPVLLFFTIAVACIAEYSLLSTLNMNVIWLSLPILSISTLAILVYSGEFSFLANLKSTKYITEKR